MDSAGVRAPRRPRHPSLVAFLLSLQWPLCTALGDLRGARQASKQQHSDAQVYYVTEVADRFSDISTARHEAAERFHDAEKDRLQAAIRGAGTQRDKDLLESAAVANEEARLASRNAIGEMLNLVTTLKQAMGTNDKAASCGLLSCGEHAYCEDLRDHAHCRCQEGYEGNGFLCRPPSQPAEYALFRPVQGAASPRIADLHVSTLRGNRVALVYRDIANQHRGHLMFGQADLTKMSWSPPILFSNSSQAFSPMLVELQDSDGIAIVFRDANRGGSGILVGGTYDADKNSVRFGPLRAFARHQAQSMGLVALPRSMVAVLFAEHNPNRATGALETGAMYGSAVLARVHTDGKAAEVVSKRRFASGPVARIATTALSPDSFAVAFRQAEETAGGQRAEASCALAQLRGGELVFDPRALSLEPERGQIWARSLAALGDGVFAYTYHSGGEQLTKQTLLRVDPETRELGVLRPAVVVGKGFTPYVGSVSTLTPLAKHRTQAQAERLLEQGNRTVTYFGRAGSTRPTAHLCKADAQGLQDRCKEFSWANRDVTSIASAQVGDGRLIFVFSDARQVPYYRLVGVMDPF